MFGSVWIFETINGKKNTNHFNILNMIAKIITDINLHTKLLLHVITITLAKDRILLKLYVRTLNRFEVKVITILTTSLPGLLLSFTLNRT